MKKFISILLSLAMMLSIVSVGTVGHAETTTDCGGDCEFYPSIVVPGIGQSNVWLLDDNGDYVLNDDGSRVNCFPAYFNIPSLISKLIFPVLLTLVTQMDIGLSSALSEALVECFAINASDGDGNIMANVEVEKYPNSLADCTDYERSQVYGNIPLNAFPSDIPEDHLYYFSYNSFGNNIQICNELYDFIQKIKEETGHDKVNIVPISLGGTVANGLLQYHPEVVNDLHKVVYIVPALNGSTIVGDVMTRELTFLDADYLYNGFLSALMDEKDAKMIEVIARILPDEVLMKCLNKAVDGLLNDVIRTSTNLWALCPKESYAAAREALLSDPEMAEIRRQADIYHEAQVNSNANIQNLVDNGVQVFCIADYDVTIYNVGNSYNTQNADGIIQLESTAMGVHSANVGETLPEDYVQQNTYCDNPEHNHISPDRVVDASTGLLPDHTFYFDNQNHESTANNDIIIKLALALIDSDDIQDVYSDPNFPQFNGGRHYRKLSNKIAECESVDTSSLTAEQLAEFNDALADARALAATTVCEGGEYEEIMARLDAALISAGAKEPEAVEEPTFFEKASPWLYENFGTNGYSEYPVVAIMNLFKAIFGLFS